MRKMLAAQLPHPKGDIEFSEEEWNYMNDAGRLAATKAYGPGSENIFLGNSYRKRRFWPANNITPGSCVLLDNANAFQVRWAPLSGWGMPDEVHYGRLHFIFEKEEGQFETWPVEKLRRPGENEGTGSLNNYDWEYEDGRPYPTVWDVIFDGKFDSPYRFRHRGPFEPARYRPPHGTRCGLYVASWGRGRRTDIYPFAYTGPGSNSEPPPDPDPEPEPDYDTVVDALQFALDVLG
jgi:hypothetical protein